jgi:mannose-6-phosphate isomerase-like protein (cupin superfamily)
MGRFLVLLKHYTRFAKRKIMENRKSLPIHRETAEHYSWGQVCDGWHLVKDENLSVIEECMPAGAAEVRHYHAKAQQFFYVLSGEAVLEVASEQITLTVGSGLHIRPGTLHQIKNLSSQPVRFLVISQPSSHGDRANGNLTED